MPAQKNLGGNEVLPKSWFSSTLWLGQKKLSEILGRRRNFVLKKGLHLNLVTIFLVDHFQYPETPNFAQIFHINARKIMVVPKYFLVTARKI